MTPGVVIVSNACSNIFDKNQKLKDGGVGYGIRRLMAERAHSAREAVKIATDLLTKYGYFSEGRTYTIADTHEAWQLAIHMGNVWVARRVQDNEVIYIPNNFMMDKVDATDTENVIVSPGLIERSIKNGRYKPQHPVSTTTLTSALPFNRLNNALPTTTSAVTKWPGNTSPVKRSPILKSSRTLSPRQEVHRS